MLFSSFTFLFFYLPLVLLLYFALPAALSRVLQSHGARLLLQNAVLLAVSLLFYGWGEPIYVFLMLATVAVNYLLGLWLAAAHRKAAVLWLAVLLDLSLLFYFKYAAFLLGGLGIAFTAPKMPLGISFYTFQAISYLADVYKGKTAAERSPLAFGTYIALFPQLVAGPIVQYGEIAEALKTRHHGVEKAADGVRRFSVGLAKKVLLANAAGELFHLLAAKEAPSALAALAALVLFALQIYYDFSGYSDMAIGLGLLFGFRFPENFNYPYIAISITDFWRRWHITLTAFFRDYVYIPLGGNRRGRWRTVRNMLAVWLLTGLWHGAAWNFVLWGLYYFLLLVLEKFVLANILEKTPRAARHALTLAAVLFGWLLFAFDGSESYLTYPALVRFLQSLLGANGIITPGDGYEIGRLVPFLCISLFGCTPLPKRLLAAAARRRPLLQSALSLCGIFLAICYLADASFNPFLYFRF